MGRWARFAHKEGLSSPSIHLTLSCNVISNKKIKQVQGEDGSEGQVACFAYKKGLDLPRLPLTLKRHPIFVKKKQTGTTGRKARFDLKKRIGFT